LILTTACLACGNAETPAPSARLAPDFRLVDINLNSATSTQEIGTTSFPGKVTAWFFCDTASTYYQSQFSRLDAMQIDLVALVPIYVQLVGVNAAGDEAGGSVMTTGVSLPFLQDTSAVAAWSKWQAQSGSVYVLDSVRQVSWVDDLNQSDLTSASNYATLRDFIYAMISAEHPPS